MIVQNHGRDAARDQSATEQAPAVVAAADRAVSPGLQGLAALAVYAAVWLATAARQLVAFPGRAQLEQWQSPDPNFYVWSLRWWPYAVVHSPNPLYSHEIGAPAGHALAWVTTAPRLPCWPHR